MAERSEIPNLTGLTELANRDGVDIKPTLLRVMTDLYAQKPDHTAEEEDHYVALALRLIDQVDAGTRAIVAKRLANYPSAPQRVIEQLGIAHLAAEPIPVVETPLQAVVVEAGVPAVEPVADESATDSFETLSAEPLSTPVVNQVFDEIVETVVEAAPEQHLEAAAEQIVETFDEAAALPVSEPVAEIPQAATLQDLSELFLSSDSEARRMILMHLDYADLPDARTPAANVAQEAIRRLEMAALTHNTEGFAQEIERALHVDRALARRLIDDESGEPLLVIAQALGMPGDVLQRILLCLNPSISHSVLRVYELSTLYEELDPQSAARLIALWQTAHQPAQRQPARPAHQPQHHDDGKAQGSLPARPAIRWEEHSAVRREA